MAVDVFMKKFCIFLENSVKKLRHMNSILGQKHRNCLMMLQNSIKFKLNSTLRENVKEKFLKFM